MDPTFIIPEKLKERLADSLVELLAGSAEQLGGSQIAGRIRKLSSKSDLLQSINRALEIGIQRFIEDYVIQDEDLVASIQADDLFWQSEMVQDALVRMVSRPGAWLRDERETVIYHFETVFPQRVNRERVDRAVSFLLRCIAEELWSLPGAQEIREAYSIQFQKLSVEAQREQVALAREQLQATTQLSSDLQQALLQLVGLMEQKVLAAPAPVAMLTSPRPYHNLPQPTYTQFVGRDDELAWLRRRLSPVDRAWQIAITGIGGVGKSALALAIGHEYRQRYHELPPEGRFEAIVWVSAKEEVLTAFGREQANVPEQVLHTLEDVYTAIARVLEREDITRAQPEEQNALVERALKRQRTLLIMDNLESVKDDRIKAFLRNLPIPTKAIITSREGLDVADVKPLTGLVWEEAEALIEEECCLREVSLKLHQRRRVFELTSGLPLPIKLGIARMAGGESFALVDRWLGDAVGELPEYCVKGQIDLVHERDPNAWIVLLACALFDREAGASREALGEIAGLSLVDRDKALAHLQRLFLVNRSEGDRFWVLPIVQRYAKAECVEGSQTQLIAQRWLDWLVRFALEKGGDIGRNIDRLPQIEVEYPNLMAGGRWCREQNKWSTLLLLAVSIWEYTYIVGAWFDSDTILDLAMEAVRGTGDESGEGWVEVRKGRLAAMRDQPQALKHLDRAIAITERLGDESELSRALAAKGMVLRQRGDLVQAEELALRELEIAEKLNDPYAKVQTAEGLAAIEASKGNFDKAQEWTDRGEIWAQEARGSRRYPAILYRKAVNMMRQGRYQEAETPLLEALDLNNRWKGTQYIALDKYRLAEVYANTGRMPLARRYAQEARELYERLGMAERQAAAERLLEDLSHSSFASNDASPS